MEKVYVVMEHEYDASWVEAVFATRELAERHLIEKQKAEWQKLVDRTGTAIPGTQQREWWFDGTTGHSGTRLISEEHYEDPGPFAPEPIDDWEIAEHKVIAA